MTVLTAQDFSAQMVAQLRILDPSVSAEVGTPERKIIDTVAQTLADNQVDLTGLSSALDIDSKFGTNLDKFTALFGFGRQQSTYATGYVIYSRNTPAPVTINIPAGATIQSNAITSQGQFLQYQTTVGGSIAAGNTSSSPILVSCVTSGVTGNSAANTLTNIVGVPLVSGVTAVTNPAPITGGANSEDDNSYKVRFKNTVFRNLAGTEDQYLALAVSTSFTTKANVIGPVSKYQEYIQVPDVDDAGYLAGIQYANGATLPNGAVLGTSNTGGLQGQWTTSQSSIPYAQDIYINPPPFISNGQAAQYFFRPGIDYNFNYPPLAIGDAQREGQVNPAVAPNFTFFNVFNPTNGAPALSGLQTALPAGVLLSEFDYLSAASRNSIQHNVYNCIDIYVDGSNPAATSCVFLPGTAMFTTSPNDPLYIENYRRDGEPASRPHPGNFFTPLFQSPLSSLPSTITVTVGATVYNYYLGYHYWLIHEIDTLGGSIRARDGIEWSNFLNADTTSTSPPALPAPTLPLSPYNQPLVPYNPGVPTPGTSTIFSLSNQQQLTVANYTYDSNITVLQASAEKSRQVTTDVLVHSALKRYFKVDATVVYTANANIAVTNAAINSGLTAYFNNLTFGNVILLSDLLAVIQSTSGVENVRWSNDLPTVPSLIRVYETDINGYPLHTPYADRFTQGTSTSQETHRLYIPGGVSNVANFGAQDSFTLNWVDSGVNFTSSPINLNGLTAASLATAIHGGTGYPGSGIYNGITVTQDSWPVNPTAPLLSFVLYYANGTPVLPTATNIHITRSYYGYDSDFYLRDNELAFIPQNAAPNDTVAGAIIRPRSQGTFIRPGIG